MKVVVDLVSPSGSPAPLPPQPAPPRLAVTSIVIAYEPDRDALMRLVESLRSLTKLIIVDNSESELGVASSSAIGLAYDCQVVRNARNLGVAEAQNIGIRLARSNGNKYVLLLDQDSILEPDALAALVCEFEALRERGERVAAVGTSHVDPRNNSRYPFVRLRHVRMAKVWPEPGTSIECDMLISSGCLISLDALDDVGEMDSQLFIDYVDFEWCRRAASKGYKVFAVADARMHHTIGDQSFRALGRSFNLHSPVRQYYFIRNALLFMRRPYLSLRWRAHLAYRVAGQLVLFGLFAPNRLRRTGWMLRGLFDGLRGRVGRLGGADGLHGMRPERVAGAPNGSRDQLPMVAEGAQLGGE
jgi:rhamnosyltransferase